MYYLTVLTANTVLVQYSTVPTVMMRIRSADSYLLPTSISGHYFIRVFYPTILICKCLSVCLCVCVCVCVRSPFVVSIVRLLAPTGRCNMYRTNMIRAGLKRVPPSTVLNWYGQAWISKVFSKNAKNSTEWLRVSLNADTIILNTKRVDTGTKFFAIVRKR